MKKPVTLFILCLLVVVLAIACGGWKWSGGMGQKEAGWTWDESVLSWDWDGIDDGTAAPMDAPAS